MIKASKAIIKDKGIPKKTAKRVLKLSTNSKKVAINLAKRYVEEKGLLEAGLIDDLDTSAESAIVENIGKIMISEAVKVQKKRKRKGKFKRFFAKLKPILVDSGILEMVLRTFFAAATKKYGVK